MAPSSNFYKTFNPMPTGYYKHAIAGSVTEPQSILASASVDAAVVGLAGNSVTSTVLAECYSVFVTPATAPPLFTFDLYFGGPSDLIVSTKSQLGPFVGAITDTTSGVIHLHNAIPFLNLIFPGALDAGGNSALARKLLNSPVSSSLFKN